MWINSNALDDCLQLLFYRYPPANYSWYYDCDCIPNATADTGKIDFDTLPLEKCIVKKGMLIGEDCDVAAHHPPRADIFLMSAILMAGTFTIAYSLKAFKTSRYLPSRVSNAHWRNVFVCVFVFRQSRNFLSQVSYFLTYCLILCTLFAAQAQPSCGILEKLGQLVRFFFFFFFFLFTLFPSTQKI